jgi:hypothetical protein
VARSQYGVILADKPVADQDELQIVP